MSLFLSNTAHLITILIILLFIFYGSFICSYYFHFNVIQVFNLPVYSNIGPKIPPSCPLKNINNFCSPTSIPVMNGLDLVQYFKDFKIIGKEEYDESRKGLKGNPLYQTLYNNYTFHFISNENQQIFSQSPDKFIPQYGGFCAWAIAGEFNYPWSSECLGPSGNWSAWTIINEKIYFFKDLTPKGFFLQDVSYSIRSGDKRWNNWFKSQSNAYFDTNCSASHEY